MKLHVVAIACALLVATSCGLSNGTEPSHPTPAEFSGGLYRKLNDLARLHRNDSARFLASAHAATKAHASPYSLDTVEKLIASEVLGFVVVKDEWGSLDVQIQGQYEFDDLSHPVELEITLGEQAKEDSSEKEIWAWIALDSVPEMPLADYLKPGGSDIPREMARRFSANWKPKYTRLRSVEFSALHGDKYIDDWTAYGVRFELFADNGDRFTATLSVKAEFAQTFEASERAAYPLQDIEINWLLAESHGSTESTK